MVNSNIIKTIVYPAKMLLLALLFHANGLVAQEITFNASLSKNPVPAGERFSITFTLSNVKGKVVPPDLSAFNVIFGPSTSSNYSWVNGKSSQSVAISYVVTADKEGKYTIGRAKAITDKGTIETDPITVSIEKSNYQPAANASAANAAKNISQNGDVILQINLSKTRAYIGEPISVAYYLYSRYTNLELGKYEFPTINGFWNEDIKQESTSWENDLATINGQRYRVAILKRQVIYPQKDGKFTVNPYELECFVNRSFFSAGQKIAVRSNSPSIEVLPFPSGAPAGFNEHTGKYKLEVSASTYKAKANEAITFKVKVSGEGNLKTINPFNIEFPSDFEVYDPKTNDKIRSSYNGLNGSREFEYLIIPRYAGEYTIAPFTFTYFDLVSKKYKSLSSGEFKFTVEKGADNAQAGTFTPGAQHKILAQRKDIRYIITAPLAAYQISPFAPNSFSFWAMFASIPLLFALVFFQHKRNKNLRSDAVKLKASKAAKMASKRLSEAKKALANKQTGVFYEAITKALYGYMADKFNIAFADLSQQTISERLNAHAIPADISQTVMDTLATCEMARFAPMSDANMDTVYEKASKVMIQLDKVLKA